MSAPEWATPHWVSRLHWRPWSPGGTHLLHQTSYIRGVQSSHVEPAQPVLSVPLYWLAYHTPWVGNVHTLYLFTPIVTALTGMLLFYYALDLGYRERTALSGALIFGLTTIVWPYTQTYFREPLTMLLLFGAMFLWQRWRRRVQAGSRSQWGYLAAALSITLLALFTKEAILIALPALILVAYPGTGDKQASGRIAVIAGSVLLLILLFFGAVLLFREQFSLLEMRYDLSTRLLTLVEGLGKAGPGLVGYIISPGKAIWWYSPVLLLALGAPLALPRERWRESWLPLALTLLFAVGYAAVRSDVWFGGTGWGARYMLPLIPILMIAALPLLDRMLNAPQWWPRLLLIGLLAWGFLVQLGGVFVDILAYDSYVAQVTGQPPWRGPAIWSFRWSQAIGSLIYIVSQSATPDILWLLPPVNGVMLSVIGLGIAAGALLLVFIHHRESITPHERIAVFISLPLVTMLITLGALRAAYDDSRYRAGSPALAELRSFLEQNTQSGDIILLASPTYVPHFMNYYKGDVTWYSLPYAPGSRYDEEKQPAVTSEDVVEQLGPSAHDTIGQFLNGSWLYTGQPIWLVEDLTPWLEWSTRPAEHFLAQQAFVVQETNFSPTVRLVEYLPLRAPAIAENTEYSVTARFGDYIRLRGYDAFTNNQQPVDDVLAPGDMLAISLKWEAVGRIEENYIVSAALIGTDGTPILQLDRPPVNGFEPTGSWMPGESIRDNVGFVLPQDLPPGRYEVWTLMYTLPDVERLPVTQEGLGTSDHLVLFTFEVSP